MKIRLLKKIKLEAEYLKISQFLNLFIIFPILIILIFTLLIYYNGTREFTQKILSENSLVENLTFLFLFSGGIFGLNLLVNWKKNNYPRILTTFLLVFSLCLFFISMEEIAWGQQFFRFKTPSVFMEYNAQNELTLHNINQFQGKSEIFRILFGLIFFLGLFLYRFDRFKVISVPYILSSFVYTILIISVFDLSDDYFMINKEIKFGTHLLSELIEMLIGLVSLLYLILIKRKIRLHPDLIKNRKNY